MDIGFVWDELKYELVRKKHDVVFHEVVSAFEDDNGYEVPDPAGQDERHMLVGQTVTNRILMVVFSEEELPLYRIITAFDAIGRWVDEYERNRR